VLGWATVHHYRSGDNPARWQGLLEHALPARNDVAKVKHHAALPYVQAPSFMAKLRQDRSVGARCLEFIALTVARLSEANESTWNEIDFDARTWTVPAAG
jgi:integrase